MRVFSSHPADITCIACIRISGKETSTAVTTSYIPPSQHHSTATSTNVHSPFFRLQHQPDTVTRPARPSCKLFYIFTFHIEISFVFQSLILEDEMTKATRISYQGPNHLIIIDRDVGTRNDGFDDGLAIWTLSGLVSFEGFLGLLEREPVSDEWFEVNLSLCSQCDAELVISRLI